MTHRIHLSSPDITELEEQFVLDAMRSGWIAPVGPDVDAFESEMSARVGVSYAVALSSGTAALHLALLGKGIGQRDVVLTSTMTFAATANAITYTGAEPYFIDCESATGNIDPNLLEETLKRLTQSGERIGAIVPVDLLGKSANYTAICRLAEEYDVPLIADAAESLGASHDGRPAGSWGDAAILSFNGNKIMTTSGGGMLLTDDPVLADRCRYLATQARQPVVHYEHTDIGYNYRLSNLLTALGRAQLSRLDEMIERRRKHRATYRALFRDVAGVSIFGEEGEDHDNFWLTSILVDSAVTGWTTGALNAHLSESNIESRPLWKPMHMQPVFSQSRAMVNGTSQHIFDNGLTLPSGSALDSSDMARISTVIQKFLQDR